MLEKDITKSSPFASGSLPEVEEFDVVIDDLDIAIDLLCMMRLALEERDVFYVRDMNSLCSVASLVIDRLEAPRHAFIEMRSVA